MIENVKIPEAPNVEPAGMITIEVTDAETGALVEREKKHNFVQERALRAASKFGAHAIFRFTSYNLLSIPAESIELTDYAGAPDPDKEVYILGNLVGYGIKDQPSALTTRGAYNAAESIVRSDYLKLVYDFATSQGNGTFQSIYTRNAGLSSDPGYFYSNMLSTIAFPFTWNIVRKAGGALYFWYSSDLYKLYKITSFDLKLSPTGYNYAEYETITFAQPLAAICAIRGNEIYKIVGNRVQKATISPPGSFAEVFNPGFSCTNIAYNEKLDRFYIEKSASGDYVTYVYSSNFTLIEVLSAGKAINGLNRVSDDGKIIIKYQNHFEIATGRQMQMQNSSNYQYRVNESVELGDYMLINSSVYSGGALLAGPQFFSRVLLDQPVTKTAQQNMKITYEFNIPPLNIPII